MTMAARRLPPLEVAVVPQPRGAAARALRPAAHEFDDSPGPEPVGVQAAAAEKRRRRRKGVRQPLGTPRVFRITRKSSKDRPSDGDEPASPWASGSALTSGLLPPRGLAMPREDMLAALPLSQIAHSTIQTRERLLRQARRIATALTTVHTYSVRDAPMVVDQAVQRLLELMLDLRRATIDTVTAIVAWRWREISRRAHRRIKAAVAQIRTGRVTAGPGAAAIQPGATSLPVPAWGGVDYLVKVCFDQDSLAACHVLLRRLHIGPEAVVGNPTMGPLPLRRRAHHIRSAATRLLQATTTTTTTTAAAAVTPGLSPWLPRPPTATSAPTRESAAAIVKSTIESGLAAAAAAAASIGPDPSLTSSVAGALTNASVSEPWDPFLFLQPSQLASAGHSASTRPPSHQEDEAAPDRSVRGELGVAGVRGSVVAAVGHDARATSADVHHSNDDDGDGDDDTTLADASSITEAVCWLLCGSHNPVLQLLGRRVAGEALSAGHLASATAGAIFGRSPPPPPPPPPQQQQQSLQQQQHGADRAAQAGGMLVSTGAAPPVSFVGAAAPTTAAAGADPLLAGGSVDGTPMAAVTLEVAVDTVLLHHVSTRVRDSLLRVVLDPTGSLSGTADDALTPIEDALEGSSPSSVSPSLTPTGPATATAHGAASASSSLSLGRLDPNELAAARERESRAQALRQRRARALARAERAASMGWAPDAAAALASGMFGAYQDGECCLGVTRAEVGLEAGVGSPPATASGVSRSMVAGVARATTSTDAAPKRSTSASSDDPMTWPWAADAGDSRDSRGPAGSVLVGPSSVTASAPMLPPIPGHRASQESSHGPPRRPRASVAVIGAAGVERRAAAAGAPRSSESGLVASPSAEPGRRVHPYRLAPIQPRRGTTIEGLIASANPRQVRAPPRQSAAPLSSAAAGATAESLQGSESLATPSMIAAATAVERIATHPAVAVAKAMASPTAFDERLRQARSVYAQSRFGGPRAGQKRSTSVEGAGGAVALGSSPAPKLRPAAVQVASSSAAAVAAASSASSSSSSPPRSVRGRLPTPTAGSRGIRGAVLVSGSVQPADDADGGGGGGDYDADDYDDDDDDHLLAVAHTSVGEANPAAYNGGDDFEEDDTQDVEAPTRSHLPLDEHDNYPDEGFQHDDDDDDHNDGGAAAVARGGTAGARGGEPVTAGSALPPAHSVGPESSALDSLEAESRYGDDSGFEDTGPAASMPAPAPAPVATATVAVVGSMRPPSDDEDSHYGDDDDFES